ncbi:MAG: DUF1926 domain-containing protein [Cyanobacteria bacterium NC_groundwater_1444_Ag_S-0.65um_54_12]|nr:DUF1926 domain-containing protein [Cyanobacteria bacterium NC_groundwater_1444_Ag_S-0.65um_54_12]
MLEKMLLGQKPKIHFAFGLHNHQPAGNMDWVIAKAYEKAYRPLLEVLGKHPGVKIALHYTGFLLEWLQDHHPEFFATLCHLVKIGQVEMVSGAYYEPILAIIPDDNKVEQISFLSREITRITGQEPEGMWLAERVWEPHLAKSLVEARIKWTCVDDTHFKATGLRGPELFGYYQTEEQGSYLQIFPINQELRLLIPNVPPEKVIDYLRQHATPDASRLVLFFDNGEKFGAWPKNHSTSRTDGWLDRLFALLEENADWIISTTLREYRASYRPWGRIYLPALSYTEMQQWCLPVEQATLFETAVETAKEPCRDFLRGGFWRHFLVRYPESNNLHKKMLAVSAQIANCMQLKQQPIDEIAMVRPADDWVTALHYLWRGQSNDPYWHGVFGGLYLAHLRSANYSALLKAEAICDKLQHGLAVFLEALEQDFDGDGTDEILLRNQLINAFFTRKGGALFELDYKPCSFNLLDTLARRPEAYHPKLAQTVSTEVAAAQNSGGGAKSLHEWVLTKEEGLERYLHYDWYRRISLLDHFLHPDSHLDSFYNVSYGEQGDFVIEAYQTRIERQTDKVEVVLWRDGHVWVGQEFWPVTVTKRITLPADRAMLRADYEVRNGSDRAVSLWFGVELNATFLAGNAPDRYYISPEVSIAENRLDSKGEIANLTILGLRDMSLRLDYQLRWEHPAIVWRFPIETVSQSEAGFERVYQGSVIMPHWRLELPAHGTWTVWLEQRITQL